jgi:hypothetical protein
VAETAEPGTWIDETTEDILGRLRRQGLQVSVSQLAPLVDHHRRSTAALKALRLYLDSSDVEPLDGSPERADNEDG